MKGMAIRWAKPALSDMSTGHTRPAHTQLSRPGRELECWKTTDWNPEGGGGGGLRFGSMEGVGTVSKHLGAGLREELEAQENEAPEGGGCKKRGRVPTVGAGSCGPCNLEAGRIGEC